MGTLTPLYRKAPGGQSLGHGAQRQSQGAREAQARRKRKIKGGGTPAALRRPAELTATAAQAVADPFQPAALGANAKTPAKPRATPGGQSGPSMQKRPAPNPSPAPPPGSVSLRAGAPPHPKALEKIQPGICENRAGVHALQLVADGPRPLETLNPYLVFLPTRPPCKFSARARPRVGEGRSHCRKAT